MEDSGLVGVCFRLPDYLFSRTYLLRSVLRRSTKVVSIERILHSRHPIILIYDSNEVDNFATGAEDSYSSGRQKFSVRKQPESTATL